MSQEHHRLRQLLLRGSSLVGSHFEAQIGLKVHRHGVRRWWGSGGQDQGEWMRMVLIYDIYGRNTFASVNRSGKT